MDIKNDVQLLVQYIILNNYDKFYDKFVSSRYKLKLITYENEFNHNIMYYMYCHCRYDYIKILLKYFLKNNIEKYAEINKFEFYSQDEDPICTYANMLFKHKCVKYAMRFDIDYKFINIKHIGKYKYYDKRF